MDSETTCTDARRSLRNASFQYSCEACVADKGGLDFHLLYYMFILLTQGGWVIIFLLYIFILLTKDFKQEVVWARVWKKTTQWVKKNKKTYKYTNIDKNREKTKTKRIYKIHKIIQFYFQNP